MRRVTGALGRGTSGVLLAAFLLTGCGGGGSDPESTPTPSGSPSGPPSDEEWTAAYAAYYGLGDAYNAANTGATDYQAAVRKVHDRSAAAVLTDPSVTSALEEQQELAATRDEQIAALAEQPAMRDPELKAAYDEFVAAAEEMNTFQDGYNESMPVFLRSLDLCTKIFSVKQPTGDLTVIPGVYTAAWIKAHDKLAAPCLDLLDQLDGSGNYRIRQYAANFRKVIRQRDDLMADLGAGKAGFDQTLARLTRVNEAFTKRNGQLTKFSDELAKISAIEEYQALDAIFQENGAAPESASPSSS